MFLEIPDVLTPAEVARLRAIGAQAPFVDGRITNPHSRAKNNLQLDQAAQAYPEASRLLAAALSRHEQVKGFVFPRIMAPPTLAKYRPGMTYGLHADAAFLPMPGRPIRSDMSCTVFLTPPEEYEGGALEIQLGSRRIAFRGAPGSAVIYPSTTLHEVVPVTAGERLVGLTFIESRIPDAACREVLYQLNEVAALEGLNMAWDNRTRLNYVSQSLERMWGEAG